MNKPIHKSQKSMSKSVPVHKSTVVDKTPINKVIKKYATILKVEDKIPQLIRRFHKIGVCKATDKHVIYGKYKVYACIPRCIEHDRAKIGCDIAPFTDKKESALTSESSSSLSTSTPLCPRPPCHIITTCAWKMSAISTMGSVDSREELIEEMKMLNIIECMKYHTYKHDSEVYTWLESNGIIKASSNKSISPSTPREISDAALDTIILQILHMM